MFDFGWSEFLLIGVVALIVIGPKELPAVLRTIGQWTTKIRRMAGEFQSQFQEAMREAEMADLKKQVDEISDAAKGITTDPSTSAKRPSGSRRSDTAPPPRRPRDRGCRARRPRDGEPRAAAQQARRRRSASAGGGRCTRRGERAAPRRTAPPQRHVPDKPRSARTADRWPRGAAGHDPRGHRGHQGAADRASGRAALAADQGAGRLRGDVRALLLLRQADLQRAGMAVRVRWPGRRTRGSSTRRCWNISSPSSSSPCSARRSCRFRWWRRRSTCSSRPASIATSVMRSCPT